VRIDLPYLMEDTDRHGNHRIFARRNGRKIRIREQPGTPGFMAAYKAALEILGATPEKSVTRGAPAVGTMGWLAAAYFASTEFKLLNPTSQATRRAIIESCLQEPLSPGSRDLIAGCPVKVFGAAHLRLLRDRRADKPGAANNRLKYVGSMLSWAVENGHMAANPARDVRSIRYASAGFHAWTPAEVEQFEARHPIGTKARLALALLLFLGVRRSDVVTLGPQNVQGDEIRMVPKKTMYRRRDWSYKPILPELAQIIAATTPTGTKTFLVNGYGRPFTAAGFGNWFRDRCNEAGLPHCSAHGLRKAGASIAADRGATDRQLMALYDWTSEQQATKYVQAANRRRLAARAGKLLTREQTVDVSEQTVDVSVPHPSAPPDDDVDIVE
jgi:integrase